METIKIQGKSYAMVIERVKEFNKQFADGSLITEIVSNEDGVVIMKASAIVNGIVVGTGHSFETVGSSQINKSSHLENCETSAIGRCLAFGCGFMPDGSLASDEEIQQAVLQQSKVDEHIQCMDISTHYLSVEFQNAIDNEDEDGILEVIGSSKMKGSNKINQPLKSAVWDTLSNEQSQYMKDRGVRLSEDKKTKSEEKQAQINKAAKDFAEKQKADK